PQPEPGAIVCRVAPSFLRFGNSQIHVANSEKELLERLVSYVVRNHYPEHEKDWFHVLCRRTALLMCDWMRLGFVHGVMNTDNMSILGLTIDYGPYGWLEGYDPSWTPNTTDAEMRRYCYGNQPEIALWNLARLAESLLPLYEKTFLEEGLGIYAQTYDAAMRKALAAKLGVTALSQPGDEELVSDLFKLLAEAETDWTIFWRKLAQVEASADEAQLLAPLAPAFYTELADGHRAAIAAWLRRYLARAQPEAPHRAERMNQVNPKYVPRNYLAQQAIDAIAERADNSFLERLMKVLERPYDEQPENEEFAARRPEWARTRPGCSALSCSS
ncbi:MAG TPA: protein adenylyltransferase SelO family protein, partial [Burkholderiales bacterium]|nr:protein adenylyltransferase SelO family protein [Burkholderiales bacterium]